MPYRCDATVGGKECNRLFDTVRGLGHHRAVSHKISESLVDTTIEKRTLTCPVCGPGGGIFGPRGLTMHRVQVHGYDKNKDIRILPGVGDLTEQTMHKLGIDTLEKVSLMTAEELAGRLGISVNFAKQMVDEAKRQWEQLSMSRHYAKHKKKYDDKAKKKRRKQSLSKYYVPPEPKKEKHLPEPTVTTVPVEHLEPKVVVGQWTMADPADIEVASMAMLGIKEEAKPDQPSEVVCYNIKCLWAGSVKELFIRWREPAYEGYAVCPKCEMATLHLTKGHC